MKTGPIELAGNPLLWVSPGSLEAPLACSAGTGTRFGAERVWCLDTAANVFVAPPGDKSIIRPLGRADVLKTSGGNTNAEWCLMRTPIGIRKGLISAGSPRLIPGCALHDLHVDYARGTVHARIDGRALNCYMYDGMPVCYHTKLKELATPGDTLVFSHAAANASKNVDASNQLTENDIPADHWDCHIPALEHCEACRRAKRTFPGRYKLAAHVKESQRSSKIGERISGDLCTPWPTAVRNKEQTLFCVIDEASGICAGFPLVGKTPYGVKDSLMRFRHWLKRVREEQPGSTGAHSLGSSGETKEESSRNANCGNGSQTNTVSKRQFLPTDMSQPLRASCVSCLKESARS